MANYVKFVRGTAEQWKNFTNRNDDTLYFIEDTTGDVDLYLGGKLIAGGEQSIGSLSIDALLDVIITNVQADQLLVYDAEQQAWVNKSLEDGISVFVGSTADSNGKVGLVPAPERGKSDLFLKADGTWAEPSVSRWIVSYDNETNQTHEEIIAQLTADKAAAAGDMIIINDPLVVGYSCNPYVFDGTTWIATVGLTDAEDVYVDGETLKTVLSNLQLSGDDKTITIDNKVLALYNFGKKYYAYDTATSTYIEQTVDADHPWKSGLEPRVVSENGELVIGWYEPNTATTEGINSALADLQTSVTDLTSQLNNTQAVVDTKANAADVYTKTETQQYVAAQITGASHLKRIKVNSYADIDPAAEGADQYIYMVPTGLTDDDNKYYEYMVIDGVIEPVGTWEVDLSEYAKKSDLSAIETNVANIEVLLNNKVDKKEGSRLITADEITKLEGIEEGATKNYITSVTDSFKVEGGLLSLVSVSASQVADLTALLDTKADKTDMSNMQTAVAGLETRVGTLESYAVWGSLNN